MFGSKVILRARKSIPLLLVILICLFIWNRTAQVPPQLPFDLIDERNSFINPIYSKWKVQGSKSKIKLQEKPISDKCVRYFQDLSKLNLNEPMLDLESIASQNTDPLIYKKSAWIRQRESEIKRSKTKRLTKEVEAQVEEEYTRELKKQSKLEKSMVEQFNHMRIYGKCFLDENVENEKSCTNFQNKLYPWMSGKFPTYENWKKEKLPENTLPVFDKAHEVKNSNCFIQQFKQQSNGQGIVIPFHLTNEQPRDKQIDNISRIIKVLRALKNRKPIQITHMGSLTRQEKDLLIEAARTEIRYLPWSYLNYFEFFKKENEVYRVVTEIHYPQQNLWFVDVSPVKNTQQHPIMVKQYLFNNINFHLSLSMIFNSFEEAIVITEHALPLLEKADYFNDQTYKEHGLLFFKSPTIHSKRPKRFNPGFHEVTSLVKSLLTPNDFDNAYFGLYKRNEIPVATKRFFDDSFQNLIDPSIMIINKTKSLSGLLISVNFQIQSTLKIRFTSKKDKLTPDFLWISQEIAGTHESIPFNRHPAVAAGIFTPKENLPKDVTKSQEICSSSWGQLNDDDKLIYVSSHQLQNWRNQGGDHFQELLKDKYKVTTTEDVKNMFVEGKEKIETVRENNEIFEHKLTSNPLTIENIIIPPTLTQPVFVHGYNEPNEAWVEQKQFQEGIIHPYYCVYDIVGNPLEEGVRGLRNEVGDEMRARLKFLLDVWFEDITEE